MHVGIQGKTEYIKVKNGDLKVSWGARLISNQEHHPAGLPHTYRQGSIWSAFQISVLPKPIKTIINGSVEALTPLKGGSVFTRIKIGAQGRWIMFDMKKPHLKWRISYNTLIGRFNNIPMGNRIYLGGSENIRGYANESIGSKFRIGREVGLKSSLAGNLELWHVFRFRKNELPLGVSFDYGVAYPAVGRPISVKSISVLAVIKSFHNMQIYCGRAIGSPGPPVQCGVKVSSSF